ncbi:WD40 repeat-like protein [Auriculariales sp. MPI-PUGE-AT-0066]|nr:WD40 repeat-like protein [Auriculariales sp. MPI-PUGE-AT-0066]
MRVKHHVHQLDKFPVYSAAWAADDVIALGGGGGANSRTGIKNKVRLVKVAEAGQKLDPIDTFELPLSDDTPMSLALAPSSTESSREFVAGINSTSDPTDTTANQNCRRIVFSEKNAAQATATRNTIAAKDAYQSSKLRHWPPIPQRVVAFSPDGSFLATGSTSNELAVLSYPSLQPVAPPITIPEAEGEMFDVSINDTYIVAATTRFLIIYSWMPQSSSPVAEDTGTKSKKSLKRKGSRAAAGLSSTTSQQLDLKELQKISVPSWAGLGATFRAARFAISYPKNIPINTLFAIVNAKVPSGRKFARKSFALRYVLGDDSAQWGREAAKRALGDNNISSFDVSTSGALLAYGRSDCAIGVLDATSLAPILEILHAHDFPATVVKFNPAANMLLSASADDTCRLVALPEGFAGQGSLSTIILIIITILVVLVAIAGRLMFTPQLEG